MDGDLIQGTLQRLLNEREGLQNTQKAAQAQQLESMRMPLPELSPIQSMVSDYLARYAQNPGMAFKAAAGASSGAPERERKAMESQLLRIQAADAEEAKMAGEALKEADVFGKTLTGLLGRGALGGKQPTPEQVRTVYNNSSNKFAQIAKDIDFAKINPSDPGGERVRWIRERTNEEVQDYIARFAVQPLGPRGEQPAESKPTDVAAPADAKEAATPAKPFDPMNLQLFFPKDSDVDQSKIVAKMRANQTILNTPTSSPEAKATAVKILQDLSSKYGDVSGYAQGALTQAAPVQPTPQAAAQPTPAVPTLPAAAQPAPQAAALIPPAPPKPQTPLISPPLRDKAAEEGRKQELGEIGKGYAKQYNEVLKGGMAAETTLNSLENIERNLEGYTTGKLTPMTTEIAAWARPFGLNLDEKLPNKEAFKKVVGQMTLNLKNVGGENNMPGSLSDSDRKFLEAMAPSLSDTPEGNRLVIDYYKRVAQRQREMAAQSEAYFDKNGTYKGFRKEWDEYAKANPLFGKSEQPKAKRIKITPDMLRGG